MLDAYPSAFSTVGKIVEPDRRPDHLRRLAEDVEVLLGRVAQGSGSDDQTDGLFRLESLANELATEWPDPSGRFTKRTDVFVPSGEIPVRVDNPFAWLAIEKLDGHLRAGETYRSPDGETFKVFSIAVPKDGSQLHRAYCTRI